MLVCTAHGRSTNTIAMISCIRDGLSMLLGTCIAAAVPSGVHLCILMLTNDNVNCNFVLNKSSVTEAWSADFNG